MIPELPIPKQLFSKHAIARRVKAMAKEITENHQQDRPLNIIAISNGALVFTMDLIRQLDLPLRLDTVSAHSYAGRESSGTLAIRRQLKLEIKNQDVLLIDDILDTGRTLSNIFSYLSAMEPCEIKTCVFLDKPSRRVVEFKADYIGFEIENKFVIGYGLDYNEYYRNLPYIGVIDGTD